MSEYYFWAEVKWKQNQEQGLIPGSTLGRTPQYATGAFAVKFEKEKEKNEMSWDLLCCGGGLSWLCTMIQREGENTQKDPPLESLIILNRKDSLSPWDCIISLGLNPLDTVHSPSCYAWTTTCKITLDLQISVDWIEPLSVAFMSSHWHKRDSQTEKREIWPHGAMFSFLLGWNFIPTQRSKHAYTFKLSKFMTWLLQLKKSSF